MHARRTAFTMLLSACLLLTALPGAASAAASTPPLPTYEQAVGRLVAQGYPQAIVDHLGSLGTDPEQGFRTAGTSADDAAAAYIARQLTAAGLTNVKLEAVPVDEWEFKSAGLSYGGKNVTATSFCGMQATSVMGVTAPVVYVGAGTSADYDAAGSVAGKICLVDAEFGWWYPYYPWAEGSLRGAAGFITAPTTADGTYFDTDTSLGTMPAEYDRSMAPAVMITRGDADALKAALAAGAVSATVTIDAPFRSMAQGGTGYNVVGEIAGSARNGQRVVFVGHHDAFFKGALDDGSAVAQLLTMARAMKMSGTTPQRTWTFLLTTAEETGAATAYYDWLYGSWYSITHTHTAWPGTVTGVINMEMQGSPGPLDVEYTEELRPAIQGVTQADPLLTPYNVKWWPRASTWNDMFNFAASGIPSVTFSAEGTTYLHDYYHTQLDTPALIDWAYFADMNQVEYLVARQLDGGLLPYDLSARADPLSAAYNNQTQSTLVYAGADPATVTRLAGDVAAFKTAAAAYQGQRASIPSSRWTADNVALMAILRDINSSLTAIDVWEETVFPYEQTLLDTRKLQDAIWELDKANPNGTVARGILANVSQMWYASYFSQATFRWELPRHQPDSKQLYFGSLARVPRLYDLTGEVRQIDAGQYASARASLQAKYGTAVADLDARLSAMCVALERFTPQIDGVR